MNHYTVFLNYEGQARYDSVAAPDEKAATQRAAERLAKGDFGDGESYDITGTSVNLEPSDDVADPDVCPHCSSRNTNELQGGGSECYDCGQTYGEPEEDHSKPETD